MLDVGALLGVEVGRVAVVVVDERVRQIADRAIDLTQLVHGAHIAGAAVAQQPELVVGIPTCAQRQPAEDVVVARHVPAVLRPLGDHTANLLGQRRCGPFVGIDEEHPVGRHRVERGVALGGVVVERPLGHVGPGGAGQRGRVVVAVGVEDQHPVGPAQADDALGDMASFVFGQDDGGYMHSESVSSHQ